MTLKFSIKTISSYNQNLNQHKDHKSLETKRPTLSSTSISHAMMVNRRERAEIKGPFINIAQQIYQDEKM